MRRVNDWVFQTGFWMVSLLIPFCKWMTRETETGKPLDPAPGYTWLALPAEGTSSGFPLDGWRRLDRLPASTADLPPPPDEPIKTAPDDWLNELAGDAPFPIRLYGRVVEDNRVVYCFLDTQAGRWFRLADGEVDAEAAIALLSGDGEGTPVVLDLADGDRYAIEIGLAELKRLNDAGPEKGLENE